MKREMVVVIAALATALLVGAVSQRVRPEEDTALLKQAQTLFRPLPETLGTPELPTTPERVALGKMLFFDPRWTLEGNVSPR